jgi:hypothetical protein
MKRLTILCAGAVALAVVTSGPALAGGFAASLPKVDVSIQIVKDDDDVARSLTLRADPLASVERLHAQAPFSEPDEPLGIRPYGSEFDADLMAAEMDYGVDELDDMGDIAPVEVAVGPASF